MEDKITEKVYCYDHPSAYRQNDGMSCVAAMAAMNNHNNDYALLANQWQNNPFAYMMIMGMMRWMYGNDWQNRYGSDPEISARFNQLSNQITDNHNNTILNDAVKGNMTRLGELANNLNVDLRAIQTGICDIKSGIQQVVGETKFSAERIINAANMGDTQIIMALKDCCCQNKELVQRMGYENQLGQRDMTAVLQQSHAQLGFNMQQGFDRTNTGLERGFSAVAYESQRQTCDIINSGKDNTQRIIDVLNNHWQADLQQRYNDARLELSQKTQNEYLINQLKGNCGC